MPITQQGALNTSAIIVPDVYVQIVPPSTAQLNGVPTNIVGIVGSASWGPVNTATIVSDYATYNSNFGPLVNRQFDAGTQLATAILQGANNFRIVRVTDGTDVAASKFIGTVGSPAITFSSIYTGSYGSNTNIQIAAGSKASTFKVIVSIPGFLSEVFDNIAGTGAAFWANMTAAINLGTNYLRGPSQLITAVAGTATTTPSATSFNLTGGTDGASGVTNTMLVGTDGLTRTGMYCLRNQKVSLMLLADMSDPTQWTTIESFGLSEGFYCLVSGPPGDSITNALTVKTTSGADSYSLKIMFGDWCYWNDPVNAVQRLVSPLGFIAGRLANLDPAQSSLNKPIYGIASTQKSGAGAGNSTYSDAELGALFAQNIDVICNPAPGGAYYAARLGNNCSSNETVDGDNYTRLTNYIAATLSAGMGFYVGKLINNSLYAQVTASITSFLKNMLGQGLLAYQSDGSLPFSVICNASNNPFSQTNQGILQCDVQVQYAAVVSKFIINVQGGQSVSISVNTTPLQ